MLIRTMFTGSREKAFLLVLMCCCWVTHVFGQDPTMEETGKWIIQKVQDDGGLTINVAARPPVVSSIVITSSYKDVSIDGCVLHLTEETFSSGMEISGVVSSSTPASVTETKVAISIRQVVNMKAGPRNLKISTTRGAVSSKSIKREKDEVVSDESNEPDDSYTINFKNVSGDNEDLPVRMKKAVNHLVQLCGDAKEKEPF